MNIEIDDYLFKFFQQRALDKGSTPEDEVLDVFYQYIFSHPNWYPNPSDPRDLSPLDCGSMRYAFTDCRYTLDDYLNEQRFRAIDKKGRFVLTLIIGDKRYREGLEDIPFYFKNEFCRWHVGWLHFFKFFRGASSLAFWRFYFCLWRRPD